MANRRIPHNLHLLHGTFKPSRHGDRKKAQDAAAITHRPPSCPSWLQGESRREWRRVCKAMAEYNILCALDRGIMSQYCSLWSQLVDAPERFNAALHGQLRLLQESLGFTPAARSKLGTLRQQDDDDGDPLA